MYFIQNPIPFHTVDYNTQTFHSWVKNVEVDDANDNLTINGEFYIYSNAYLPQGSYYLDFKTYFGSVDNIDLIYQKNLKYELSTIGKTKYIIDLYTFSFNLPIKDSKYFNDYIIYKNINYSITPHFKTSVLNDVEVETQESTLNKFVQDINKSVNYGQFFYQNTYKLENDEQKINVSLNNDKNSELQINLNNFQNLNRPIFNILEINKSFKIPLIIDEINLKFNFSVNNKSNTYAYQNRNLKFEDECISIKLNESIIYDYKNEQFVHFNGTKGIFLPKANGKISGVIKFQYLNHIRYLMFDRDFNFQNNEKELSDIVQLNDYHNAKKLTNLLQNEKIY